MSVCIEDAPDEMRRFARYRVRTDGAPKPRTAFVNTHDAAKATAMRWAGMSHDIVDFSTDADALAGTVH